MGYMGIASCTKAGELAVLQAEHKTEPVTKFKSGRVPVVTKRVNDSL